MSGTVLASNHKPSHEREKAYHWANNNFHRLPKESVQALVSKCEEGGISGADIKSSPLGILAGDADVREFFSKYGVDLPENIMENPLMIYCREVTSDQTAADSVALLFLYKMGMKDICTRPKTHPVNIFDQDDDSVLGV